MTAISKLGIMKVEPKIIVFICVKFVIFVATNLFGRLHHMF